MTSAERDHLDHSLQRMEPLALRLDPASQLTVNGKRLEDSWEATILCLQALRHLRTLLDSHRHLYPPTP